MWDREKSVFYQIYPIGFTGAPYVNDGIAANRIKKVTEWIGHIKRLNVDAVYFSPVFESVSHGYDTTDYTAIDRRLGSNADFAEVCRALHAAGIKVVLDGVFNHVGRQFAPFLDVKRNKGASRYAGWFNIDFNGNSAYDDGFWYEGWEGHYELVKLNLRNPEVREYLYGCVDGWIDEFDIDGLRLDVAYMLDADFMRGLRRRTLARKSDFFLIGESIHGDYNRIVNDEMLMSSTNYECYKGLYSAFNSRNMFEIAHSIARQFGREPWTLYRGKRLMCFADNHDVSRIASVLTNRAHLPLLYTLLFTMPGIPCIYYGSEWGAEGVKQRGSDENLRPCFDEPIYNELAAEISKLAAIHRGCEALCRGEYDMLALTNLQYVFMRSTEGERIVTAINIDDNEYTARVNVYGEAEILPDGERVTIDGAITLGRYEAKIFRLV